MSLREKQQMSLDTESATHTGMEGQSRCSHKYLLLQVWCGLLTVAMVGMATFLTSIKQKPTEDKAPTLKPVNVSPTDSTIMAPSKLIGSPFSCIQLTKSLNDTWHQKEPCPRGTLNLRNDTIHCTKNGLYFIYAHVTFSSKDTNTKSVLLKRNRRLYRTARKLVEGTYPNTARGSVWVAKIVRLEANDSISLEITGNIRREGTDTFWGAYQLQ